MPLRFTSKAVQGGKPFQCDLESRQCDAHSARTDERCRRRCVIGLTKCWSHTRSELHLRIKDSELGGKGVFAYNPHAEGKPVFRGTAERGQNIIPYLGEEVTDAERKVRYGNSTAPYLMSPVPNRFIDSACIRGIGGMINHAPQSKANCTFTQNGNVRAIKSIKHGTELLVNYGRDGKRAYRFDDNVHDTTRVRPGAPLANPAFASAASANTANRVRSSAAANKNPANRVRSGAAR